MHNRTLHLLPPCVYPIEVEQAAEAARLTIMSRVVTRHLNALLPPALRGRTTIRVLDVGCGPGGWIHDLAYEYPKGEVIGIDISDLMLGLARSGAQAQGLDNAHFKRLDATGPLPFVDESFDLVQARFANGFLQRDTWPRALREWARVTRPGGYLRLMESDELGRSSDPAFEEFQRLLCQACLNDPLGRVQPVTPHLAAWVQQAGFVQVREQMHLLNISAALDEEDMVQRELHLSVCQSLEKQCYLLKPFLLTHLPLSTEDLDRLCEQVMVGMMQPDFRGHVCFLEVVGTKPEAQP